MTQEGERCFNIPNCILHPGRIFPVIEVLREDNWVMENNVRWDKRFGRFPKQLPRVS